MILSSKAYFSERKLDFKSRSLWYYDFADAAKNMPFYKNIIPTMVDYFETEHYVFTHGWIPCISNRDKSYSYRPSAASRSRCTTGSCCTSGWRGWRRTSLCTSSGIADMPCLVLYSCSWRIWPPLVQLVCGNLTITHETIFLIAFSSIVQHVL